MKKRLLKLALVLVVPIMLFGSTTPTSQAFPPFLAKAEKFGAKDCAFCHATAAGGKTWNARGRWLMAEKKRRGADQIDVEWLANYKSKKGK
jgi:hypothetical protein